MATPLSVCACVTRLDQKTARYARVILAVFLFVFSSPLLTAPSYAQTDQGTGIPKELVVGATFSTSTTTLENFTKQLEHRLKPLGIENVDFRRVKSNTSLQDMIDNDEVDITLSHGVGAIKVLSSNSTAPILQTTHNDFSDPSIVIAVRKDSSIHTLDDLRGRVIAYEDVGMSRGFFTPSWVLLSRGYTLNYLASLREVVPAAGISFVFAGDEHNQVAWLRRGLVDAIAMGRNDWEDEEQVPLRLREDFHLILDEEIFLPGYAVIVSRAAVTIEADIVAALAGYYETAGDEPMGFMPISPLDDQYLQTLSRVLRASKNNYLAHE